MDREFYTISVYVDENENLIGIPCGESDKYGIADIDTVLLLKAPYTDKALEDYIEKVINACYTKKHNDSADTSTIERYTKKKGFANATKDFTMISIVKRAKWQKLSVALSKFISRLICSIRKRQNLKPKRIIKINRSLLCTYWKLIRKIISVRQTRLF